MERNHLSLIFYFLINIVIFASTSSVDDLFGRREGDAAELTGDAELQSGMTFDEMLASLSRMNVRSEVARSDDKELAWNADREPESAWSAGDENFRDTLNHITRDVRGKAATATPKSPNDTFNGKLIHVLFIGVALAASRLSMLKFLFISHRPFMYTYQIDNLLFCFDRKMFFFLDSVCVFGGHSQGRQRRSNQHRHKQQHRG